MKFFYSIIILSFFITIGYSQTAQEYEDRGNAKYDLKDYRGAIEEYTKAIRLNPNAADAYICRGNNKIELNDLNLEFNLFKIRCKQKFLQA